MSASSGRRSTTRSGSRKASASTVARRAPRRSIRSHTREMQQTVLVVDDEPIVRDVVVRYLERDGFRTLTASDGDTPPRETIAFGEVELDGASREARREGSVVQLTAKEFELLWFLASHPRHVFSRDQLMARIWGYEAAVDTGTVTVHVRRLREKIEADPGRPRHLRTVWGVGYRLDP